MIRRWAILIAIAAALIAGLVSAAAPIPVVLDQSLAFRNVLEDHDLFVLSRYRLLPSSQAASDTFTSVTVTSGVIVGGLRLTNRHTNSDTTDMTVRVASGPTPPPTATPTVTPLPTPTPTVTPLPTVTPTPTGTIDITDDCTLGEDGQLVSCTTWLQNGTYIFTVTYLAGWSAYSGEEAIYQLADQDGLLVASRTLDNTGYGLVGLYVASSTYVDFFLCLEGVQTYGLAVTPFYGDTTGWTVLISGEPTTAYTFNPTTNQITFDTPPPETVWCTARYPYTGGVRWGSANARARLMGSPTLWTAPSTKTQPFTWRSTATQAATKTQLETDLKQQLRYLEIDNGAVDTGDYVDGAYITDAGRSIAMSAWASLIAVIPTAFQTSEFNPVTPWVTKPASLSDALATAAATTAVGQAASGLGTDVLGQGGATFGLAFTVVASVVAVIGVLMVTGKTGGSGGLQVGLSVAAVWLVFFFGMLIGWTPDLWFWLATAVLLGGGLLELFRGRIMREG